MAKSDPTKPLRLEESWIYKVSVLADLVARRVGAVVQEVSGLNLSQWRVIAAVADQPGRTASQVVDLTPMDKGLVSRSVALLVRRGLIERRASAEDGRLSHLFLTGEGAAIYDDIVSALDKDGASGRHVNGPITPADLVDTLNAVITAYRDHADG